MEGKQSVVLANPAEGAAAAVVGPGGVGNPLVQAQNWVKEKQEVIQVWLSQQPLYVEAAVATAVSAFQGGILGGLMAGLNKDVSASLSSLGEGAKPPSFMMTESLASTPIVQARNLAVLTGANTGISCVLKRVRGVEDIQNSVVAAFGSGVMFSLVSSGGGGPDRVVSAVTTGAFFALIQGGIFKIGEMMTRGKSANEDPRRKSVNEDVYYVRARSMLTELGLQKYENNFRRGLLTDITLPLLTDSALRDVKIPPGPRLVILDHIQRDPGLMRGRHQS